MTQKKSNPPIEVKRGSVTVKIYLGKNRVNGKNYSQYTVIYYDGPRRSKLRFADLGDARREAGLIAEKLNKGENQVLRLTSTDRTIYLQATNNLRSLNVPLNVAVQEYLFAVRNLPVGTTLREAVLEYSYAVKNLPDGMTLKEAVDFVRKRHPASFEKRTVRQVANEMIAAKKTATLSEVYLWDLNVRLNRFSDFFQSNISAVSGTMIQAWLDAMKGSGRTKQNYLRVVAALFRFAIKHKYLPKEAMDEINSVQQAKADNGEIKIFTPTEMNEILCAAKADMIPCLAIAGFAGLRSAELQRLDWAEVNLVERHIEIKASNAKTAARRLAPITDNLAAWLAPHAKASGKLTSEDNWWSQIPKVVEGVNEQRRRLAEQSDQPSSSVKKFIWKHNALRHSYCSYRLAAIKNAAQVALEAGNSPQMIFQHYRQLVTETEANSWFVVFPKS